jgi:tRNA/tmRNA/rRNA uracil-C5-methylase (TrmA/RlmC/RlmD family)
VKSETPLHQSRFMHQQGPELTCPHRPPCPGCPRFGEHGIAPEARDVLNTLAHNHGLGAVSVISGASRGFRLRARLAIRGRLGSPKLGLFEAGTHHVVHIPSCRVQHPLINHVAAIVRGALVDTRISCYSDTAQLGLARYLQVVIERRSQTAQVVLVAHCPTAAPLAECLELIRARLGTALHSLWFNANLAATNAILGPHFERWHGPETLIENFGGNDVHYPPGAFGQSNLEIAQTLISELRAQIPEQARVAEFYAGVGAIGLSLLERASTLAMNEMAPQSLYGLALGIAALDEEYRSRISVIPGSAGSASGMATGAEAVIADPPRKGLDEALMRALASQPPERFLYVSCALDSLLRDTAQLTASGRLRLSSLKAFNLLPFTTHVESLACFERA